MQQLIIAFNKIAFKPAFALHALLQTKYYDFFANIVKLSNSNQNIF